MYTYRLLVISEHSSGLTLGQLLQPLFSVPLVIIHLSCAYPHNKDVAEAAPLEKHGVRKG